jgi:hypothetical protein
MSKTETTAVWMTSEQRIDLDRLVRIEGVLFYSQRRALAAALAELDALRAENWRFREKLGSLHEHCRSCGCSLLTS